jgi:hypothetical protein
MSYKEFVSREAMLEYEKEREQYYMDGISICNRRHIFQFYKMLFLETFHPKHRAIKKEYDNYCGGWWRNDKGWACADYIQCIDPSRLCDDTVCLEYYGQNHPIAVYIYKNNVFHKIQNLR